MAVPRSLWFYFSFSSLSVSHQSSRFRSLDHPTFPPVRLLDLFIFPPFLSHSFSPEVPPSPPPSSVSVYLCLSPPLLPQMSSDSLAVAVAPFFLSSFSSPSPPSPALSPALNLFFPRSHHVCPLFRLVPPVSCLLKHQRSQRAVETTRGFYPQFTSPRNEDDGRSRCRVQTLNEAIKRSLWVSFGGEVRRDGGVWCRSQLSVFPSDVKLLKIFSYDNSDIMTFIVRQRLITSQLDFLSVETRPDLC